MLGVIHAECGIKPIMLSIVMLGVIHTECSNQAHYAENCYAGCHSYWASESSPLRIVMLGVFRGECHSKLIMLIIVMLGNSNWIAIKPIMLGIVMLDVEINLSILSVVRLNVLTTQSNYFSFCFLPSKKIEKNFKTIFCQKILILSHL